MAGPYPFFWSTPFRYMRWAAHEKPALIWSVFIGLAGPLAIVVVPRIQNAYGYERRPLVPATYPVPTGPRKTLDGYEDA